MADVRAEILAASKSRTGWLDGVQTTESTPSSSPPKPYISTIRSTFESRSSDGSDKRQSRGEASSRRLGSKVSSIANMFQQSLSPQREEPKAVSAEAAKPQTKNEPQAEKPRSGPSTLTRSDSHVARFYNARAMFERLEEASKKTGGSKKSSLTPQSTPSPLGSPSASSPGFRWGRGEDGASESFSSYESDSTSSGLVNGDQSSLHVDNKQSLRITSPVKAEADNIIHENSLHQQYQNDNKIAIQNCENKLLSVEKGSQEQLSNKESVQQPNLKTSPQHSAQKKTSDNDLKSSSSSKVPSPVQKPHKPSSLPTSSPYSEQTKCLPDSKETKLNDAFDARKTCKSAQNDAAAEQETCLVTTDSSPKKIPHTQASSKYSVSADADLKSQEARVQEKSKPPLILEPLSSPSVHNTDIQPKAVSEMVCPVPPANNSTESSIEHHTTDSLPADQECAKISDTVKISKPPLPSKPPPPLVNSSVKKEQEAPEEESSAKVEMVTSTTLHNGLATDSWPQVRMLPGPGTTCERERENIHWQRQQEYYTSDGMEPSSNSVLLYSLAASSGRPSILLEQDGHKEKYDGGLKHAAGETLAELENKEHELFNVEAVIDSQSYQVGPYGDLESRVDGSVEFMTQEEADKLLSTSPRQEILSDEEAQEVQRLLAAEVVRTPSPVDGSDEGDEDGLKEDAEHGFQESPRTSMVVEGVEYHILPDGHFFTEQPGLDSEEEDTIYRCPTIARKQAKVKFSTAPIKVFSTHSVEDYDRRNEDVDPVSASAEYELEKRIEKMDVFPVDLEKGPEGLGLSIIGMGVGADAGLEKLGIFVKTITEGGAAYKDKRIRVNDQIIEVDGKSLVGVTQAYAASVLRNTSGKVKFLIGRERDVINSEIAQLISQSIQADREREARQKAMFEKPLSSPEPFPHMDSVESESPASTPEEGEDLPVVEVFDLSNDSSDSMSPDTDPDALRLRFKEVQYRLAVTEAELRSMKEKLELAEGERKDLARILEATRNRLQEAEGHSATLREESTKHHQSVVELQDQVHTVESKYSRAKKLIKEFQQREQEASQREEFHLQQLQEKDQEYNALVKALKDRVILLENCLMETQRTAGLPVQLPYDNTMKHLTPQLKKKAPVSGSTSSVEQKSDVSDNENSESDLTRYDISPDEEDIGTNRRATMERRVMPEDSFDKAIPQTELLDSTAAKAKAELATKGSLANRQPPSLKKQSSSGSTEGLVEIGSPEEQDLNTSINSTGSETSVLSSSHFSDTSNTSDSSPRPQSRQTSDERKAAVLQWQNRGHNNSSGLLDSPSDSKRLSGLSLSPPSSPTDSQRSLSPPPPPPHAHKVTLVSHKRLSSSLPRQGDNRNIHGHGQQELIHSMDRRYDGKMQNMTDRRPCNWYSGPVEFWTSSQVGQWLMRLGMEQYVPGFTASHINGDILLYHLDSARLKDLGVVSSNDRSLLKKKIKELKAQVDKERKAQEKEMRAREKLQKKADKMAKKK